MIDPKAYRVGNLAKIENGRVVIIYSIDVREKYLIVKRYGEPENFAFQCFEVEPIEITPEWLGKCGFMFDEYHFQHKNMHHIVCHPEGGYIYRVPGVSLVEVKYVHQIQNLFYALTGTLLEPAI